MKRLLGTLVCAAALLAAMASRPGTAQGRRPNVLFLFTDDQRADALGALGNPAVKTPNIDTLVRRGFVFRNAYCLGANMGAVCTPSRNMLLSGRAYFRWNGPLAPGEGANLPNTFRSAGYETYHHGKRGNSATLIQAQFEHNRYLQNDQAERLSGEPGQEIADAAVEFLKTRRQDRPFCMYLAFANPHDPKAAAPKYLQQYDESRIPLPRNYLPQHPFDNGEMTVRDEQLAPWPRTESEIRKHLRDYYAVMTALDGHIGRILAALRERGEEQNTFVVYSSDHGLALGSHGLMGKQNLYEAGMKPPLVFAGPGIRPGGSPALAYLLDIYPTLCDLTNVIGPELIDGKSLAPVIRGTAPAVRDRIFLAYRDVQRAVRDTRWKLIRYPQVNKTQLFDLENDPDELRDLSADSTAKPHLERLTADLRRLQEHYGDDAPLTVAQPRDPKWTPPGSGR